MPKLWDRIMETDEKGLSLEWKDLFLQSSEFK